MSSTNDENYSGTDLKSILINLASVLLFIVPGFMYLYQDIWHYGVIGVGISFLIAFVVPPIGWKRPHPYSDMPENKPYPRKAD